MLKKYTLSEIRIRTLNGFIKSLSRFRMSYRRVIGEGASIESCAAKLMQYGEFSSDSWFELTKEIYGYSKNLNDPEFLMAQILTGYALLLSIKSITGNQYDNSHSVLMNNIKEKLVALMPEFSFGFSETKAPTFKPTEEKTIIDNIQNTDAEIANPIKQLLMPMQSENESIGLISKVYVNLEKIKYDSLTNLNKTDQGIAKRAKDICRTTVNNVKAAKGHEGRSELSIKDIAHNFALNASLFFRLVELNKEKEDK